MEYAYRHRDDYDAILWTLGQTEGGLVSGFEEIALELGLAGEDPEQRLAAVHRWMREHESWLLVVDNADEPELLKPYLPAGAKGHVLLTSRARYFGALAIPDPLQLDTLSPEDALAFLIGRVCRESTEAAETEAARALAEELGYLPLALEQAGAYLAAKQTRFEDYLAAYRERRGRVLERSRPETGDYPHGVAETWLLNFEAVEAISEASADVLRVSAFLAPDLIPEELLVKGASELGPAIAEVLGDSANSLALDELLEPISRYSLIRRIPQERAFGVHRLVQEVVQDNFDGASSKHWVQKAVRGLRKAFPGGDLEFESWERCARLVPHVVTVYRSLEPSDESEEEAVVLNQAALYLGKQGRSAQALPLCERSLQISEKALGEDHPSVAASLTNLGSLYMDQGEYVRAAPLLERALLILEKVLDNEHPDIATCLNNLAGLHQNQGNYARAVPLFQRSLQIREKVLDNEHPDVARSLNNLGGIYVDQGHYEQAEPFLKRSLQIIEKVRGENHPEFAWQLRNLGGIYVDQGKYERAEPLLERSLQITKKILDHEHPEVAISLDNLANLYFVQGNYAQAAPLLEGALRIMKKVLGGDHNHVATILNNLGQTYHAQGDHAQAVPLFERALLIYEKVLGDEHPHVASSLNNLAILHHAQGNYAQAASLFERSLQIREKVLGEEHPDIATSLHCLASLHQDQGEYAQAAPLFERSLQIREKVLGDEHPDVALSLNNLAKFHKDQGDYAQAASLLERALLIYEKVLGEEHHHTKKARRNYASIQKAMADQE